MEARTFRLKSLEQTCSACPSQWEGRTTDDQYVYVRFRWGGLSVSVDPVEDRVYVDGQFRAGAQVSDGLDSYMTTDQMLLTAREVLGVELVVRVHASPASRSPNTRPAEVLPETQDSEED